MLKVMASPLKLFISYSHLDEIYRNELLKQLRPLERQKLITIWSDVEITPGEEWELAIRSKLNDADIVVLLISSDFLASDFCTSVELKTALKRHAFGRARVVPIVVRDCDWQSAPFAKLQVLPERGKPITSWATADSAWRNVTQQLRALLEKLSVSDGETESADGALQHTYGDKRQPTIGATSDTGKVGTVLKKVRASILDMYEDDIPMISAFISLRIFAPVIPRDKKASWRMYLNQAGSEELLETLRAIDYHFGEAVKSRAVRRYIRQLESLPNTNGE